MKTIDARDYAGTGADPSGIVTSHNAFNAMLEDARLLGGATLHFPCGTWLLSGPVLKGLGTGVLQHLVIKGEGGGTRFKFNYNLGGTQVITLGGYYNLKFKDCVMLGSVGPTADHARVGIYLTDCIRAIFDNVEWVGIRATESVLLGYSTGFVFRNNRFVACRSRGVNQGVISAVGVREFDGDGMEFEDTGAFDGINYNDTASEHWIGVSDPVEAATQDGPFSASFRLNGLKADEAGATKGRVDIDPGKTRLLAPVSSSSRWDNVIINEPHLGMNTAATAVGIRVKNARRVVINGMTVGDWTGSNGQRDAVALEAVDIATIEKPRLYDSDANSPSTIRADNACGLLTIDEGTYRDVISSASRLVIKKDGNLCRLVVNGTGGAVAIGDVVKLDTTTDDQVVQANADDDAPLVVAYLLAGGGNILVTEPRSGSRIKVNANGAVARGDILTAAGGGVQAKVNNGQTDPDKILGRALRAIGAAGLVLAEVW